jgi:hypothetical protein
MQVTSIHSQGGAVVVYDGPPDSMSLRNKLREYCDAFANGVEFDPETDHPRRELGVARMIKAMADAYVSALETEQTK